MAFNDEFSLRKLACIQPTKPCEVHSDPSFCWIGIDLQDVSYGRQKVVFSQPKNFLAREGTWQSNTGRMEEAKITILAEETFIS
jgi:hypothetical protein